MIELYGVTYVMRPWLDISNKTDSQTLLEDIVAMSELLSNTKKRYIENWRQSVCQHMESGTICRVTISEMTPEPCGYITSYIKPSKEHEKAMVSMFENSRHITEKSP